MVFLTAKQRVLVVLLREGPLQNSQIAEKTGVTEQYCSRIIKFLRARGLVETDVAHPRHISKLTRQGALVAYKLAQVTEVINQK